MNNQPSYFEIELINTTTNSKYLVCYSSGSKSRRALIRLVLKRWDRIQSFIGHNITQWDFIGKTNEGLKHNEWVIKYSGRTELQAKAENVLPYIGKP